MKHSGFHRAIVAIAMMLIGWLPSLAHDFEVDGIFYNKTSDNTVAVTYKGDSFTSYSNEYAGNVVIPSSVNYNGTTYSVTSIVNYAFFNCYSLTSIEIPNSVISIGYFAFAYCESLTSIVVDAGNTKYDSRNGCNAIIETASNTLIEGCKNTIISNSITGIGTSAFGGCSGLTSIEIPNSVTTIGERAFRGCESLTSVVIGNSVTSIGDYAFSSCSSLTSIQIPNSVTSIGGGAFSNCENLTSIEIGNSVTTIEEWAFSDCSSLTSIIVDSGNTKYDSRNGCNAIIETASNTLIAGCQNTIIPNSVTSIGDYAFSNCSSLTSIQIPNSVTSIELGAFDNCENLTSVIWNSVRCSDFYSGYYNNIPFENCPNITSFTFGDEVEHIPAYLCYNLSSLTSIEIPNSVTSIGEGAFSSCSSLTSIQIPYSVTSIGDEAFEGCSSLTSIEIGNSVTSIGDYAFSDCSRLTSVKIGNSVTSIGDYAFSDCSRLTKITCLATTPPTIRSSTFSNYSAKLYVPAGCISAYQSANFWKKFSNIIELEPELEEGMAFEYGGLTYKVTVKGKELAVIASESGEYSGAVVIPSSVSSVDYSGATYSVTSIGSSAFSGCSSLTSIQIPNSVTSIGSSAFSDCSSLTSIEIPNSVTSIGNYAFSYCSSLTSVEIGNSVTSIGYGAFLGCYDLTSIQIPNSVTSIGDYTFDNCSSMTSVEIPNSVTSIGNYAFYDCSRLTSIEIPNSVTSIGYYAFGVCTSLTSIEIPNSVTSIGEGAFLGCSSLTSIVVDAGNSKYDSRNGCNAIIETASNTLIAGCQNTIIPNSVTSIGDYAFLGCESLTSIEIPNSVTSIGYAAFYWCTSLTSIEIPNGVTSIGDWAFYDCESLTKIICLATNPPAIVSTTFSNYSAELYVPSGCKSAYQSANYWENFNIKEIPTLSTSIALNQTTATLKATETLTLVATVLPENTTNKSVTWKSSNEAVAIVDANGKVTAVAVGETTITATTTDGSNLSASCKVTVVPTLAESITLDKTEISLEATETATLIATVLPELTTDKSVEWSSSDETVAVVDENGVVTAISAGDAIITATVTDGSDVSATCQVTVIPTMAVSIELDQTEASVEEKSEFQLTATILPEHATNKEVAWSSSDKWVASVDNTGLVTMYSAGEVVITATTTDGTNLSATCRINVYSGIDGVEGDDLIVATIGDNILVKNAQLGSNVRIYAADGSIISSEVATDGDVVVVAPIKGVYIVSVNGKTFKVMVK